MKNQAIFPCKVVKLCYKVVKSIFPCKVGKSLWDYGDNKLVSYGKNEHLE